MADKLHDGLAPPKLDGEVERAKVGVTRRELFQIGNVLAMPVLLGGVTAHAEGTVAAGPRWMRPPGITCRWTNWRAPSDSGSPS